MSTQTKTSAKNACPHCGSTQFIQDHATSEVICRECGLVVREQLYDRGPEWRAYDREEYEEKSRAGPPSTETIHDKGLSTQIDWKNRDAQGKPLSPKRRSEMYRLRKWQKRSRVEAGAERNLALALGEIGRICSQLGLPQSVQEASSRTYRKTVEAGLIRGRSIESVTGAVIYHECKEAGVPRTLREIAEYSRVDVKAIARTHRYIQRELDLTSRLADPADFVNRFSSKLDLPAETQAKARELIGRARKTGVTAGKSPRVTAAAAIYITALDTGERRTQTDVAKAAGVTEVSVRNRFKEIADELGLEITVPVGATPGEVEAKKPEAKPGERKIPRVEDISVRNVTIENIVATVDFDAELELEKLSRKLDGAEYAPDKFPGVVYDPEEVEPIFLIFESGKTNCVGSRTMEELDRAVKSITRKLEDRGFIRKGEPRVEVRNVVYRADFGAPVNLAEIHGSDYMTSYDPETFPGLHLELEETEGDFLLFTSGQGIGHVKREEDIEKALEEMKDILREFAVGELSEDLSELLKWVEENPRYLKLLKILRDGAMSVSRIARELGVKYATAKGYVSSCAERGAVKREKRGRGYRAEITESGRKILNLLGH